MSLVIVVAPPVSLLDTFLVDLLSVVPTSEIACPEPTRLSEGETTLYRFERLGSGLLPGPE